MNTYRCTCFKLDRNPHLNEWQMKWHNEMIYENTVTGSDVIYMVLVSIILQDPYVLSSHKSPWP